MDSLTVSDNQIVNPDNPFTLHMPAWVRYVSIMVVGFKDGMTIDKNGHMIPTEGTNDEHSYKKAFAAIAAYYQNNPRAIVETHPLHITFIGDGHNE